jgi:hypothetical protein
MIGSPSEVLMVSSIWLERNATHGKRSKHMPQQSGISIGFRGEQFCGFSELENEEHRFLKIAKAACTIFHQS